MRPRFDKSSSTAEELIRVLPYLYPSPEARQTVTALSSPSAYIEWARAAAGSEDISGFLSRAEELTLALNEDGKERQDFLGEIGVLYAQQGRLLKSTNVALRAASPDARLKIYTAILRYDTIRARPAAKEFLERDFAIYR